MINIDGTSQTFSEDDRVALDWLVNSNIFKPGQWATLANALAEVAGATGYGSVSLSFGDAEAEIVLSDRKVQSVKVVKSYK